ncbi:MAG: P-II family nitrogen regulator [Clostridiales bacterium]|nr:P-II family nitrogen regulator [Clostridiales bacterium]
MTEYELIMCIVNAGFSETVMEAAKEKGARGGTILHARGTANKSAEAFFNITIQPDKEIVMILVKNEIRDDVMHALYQQAGLKTAGQGIAFALPVTNTVGLTPLKPIVPNRPAIKETEEKPEAKTEDKPKDEPKETQKEEKTEDATKEENTEEKSEEEESD